MTAIAEPALRADFRAAFRGHPGGLAIITAAGPDGPTGLTASSVTSLSADPPALSFSVAWAGATAAAIRAGGSVLVHLLDAPDVELARWFAEPGDRFTTLLRWTPLPSGEPHLDGTGLALRCRVLSLVEIGPSMLVAAGIVEMLGARRGDRLVYADRGYHVLPG